MAWMVRPRTLYDLTRHKANLRVSCLDCRHCADFEAARIIEHFRMMRWAMAWELLYEHFRCRRCKGKRIRCDMVGAPDPPPPVSDARPRPAPVVAGLPPPRLRVVGRDAEPPGGAEELKLSLPLDVIESLVACVNLLGRQHLKPRAREALALVEGEVERARAAGARRYSSAKEM